jgi:Tol biopolymer transport system component
VVGDTNPGVDVFVRNLATGAVRMVSTTSTGHPVLFQNYRPQWSPDGTRIAFMSLSPGLIPSFTDTNNSTDVYIKNLSTGLVQLVSINASGQLSSSGASLYEIGGPSNNAWLAGGKGIVFASGSPNLAPGDGNAFQTDLFIKQL